MFEHVTPMASATPDGHYYVDTHFQKLPHHILEDIEDKENTFRNQQPIINREFIPTKNHETIGLRKSASIRDGNAMFRNSRDVRILRSRRRVKIKTNKSKDLPGSLEIEILRMIYAANDSQLNSRDFGLHRVGDPAALDRIKQHIEREIRYRHNLRYTEHSRHLR